MVNMVTDESAAKVLLSLDVISLENWLNGKLARTVLHRQLGLLFLQLCQFVSLQGLTEMHMFVTNSRAEELDCRATLKSFKK